MHYYFILSRSSDPLESEESKPPVKRQEVEGGDIGSVWFSFVGHFSLQNNPQAVVGVCVGDDDDETRRVPKNFNKGFSDDR